MKSARKKSTQLASRKILAFHRKHIGSLHGVQVTAACRAILALLKINGVTGGLKIATLAAIARHDGALPILASRKPKPAAPTTAHKQTFYRSWEWATLRMKVLKANGGRCECCGAGAHDTTLGGDPVRLHVDHIKPISKFWELMLEASNLQVLCAECNQGKGAWDNTDWRMVCV